MIAIESAAIDCRKHLERAPALQPLNPLVEIATMMALDAH